MAEDAVEPGGRTSDSPEGPAGNGPDRYDLLLNGLRSRALEKTWNDRVKISGLLYDAGLNPDDYPLDGSSANTLWANLIPVLKDRGELAQVLRVVQPRVGRALAGIVEELASYFEHQTQQLVEQYLGGVQAQAKPAPRQRETDERVLAVPTDKRVFLSHASADKALADLVRNTLVFGGLRKPGSFIPLVGERAFHLGRMSVPTSDGRCETRASLSSCSR